MNNIGDMKETKNLEETKKAIEKTIELSKFFNDNVKKLVYDNNLGVEGMKDILQDDYNKILDDGKVKVKVPQFVKQYNTISTNLAKGLEIDDIGMKEFNMIKTYVEFLNPDQIKNPEKKSIEDILLASKLLPKYLEDSDLLSKSEEDFFHKFNNSVFNRY